MRYNEKGEQLVEHHIKYKEIHGKDETVWMTKGEHESLHYRLRREGKCNISVEKLTKISIAANNRTEKRKKYAKTPARKKYHEDYQQKPEYKNYQKNYYKINKEKKIQYQIQYQKDHKEERNRYQREYRAKKKMEENIVKDIG